MTWHNGNALFLLALIPLLGGLSLLALARRRAAEKRLFGGQPTLLISGRAPGLRVAKALILLTGVACVIVALARPQYGSRTRMLKKRGVDVVIALDFSKSMLARDVKPNRIDRAKAEIIRFVGELGGDRVGLVAFAGDTMEFPMTVDYSAAALFMRDISPFDMPVGGTAIGRALTAAGRMLQRAAIPADGPTEEDVKGREKVVILFTDGEDHEGDPVASAQELKALGARVYVVGIGSRTGEMIPTYADDGTWTGYLRDDAGNPVLTQMTQENEGVLKKVAEVTGGKYFAAEHGRVGMASIRTELRHMKQSELQARRITVHEERYALVLVLGLLLIVLESILPDRSLRLRAPGAQP